MNSYQLIYNYKGTDKYRLSFNQLAQDTFGIDLEQWYQDGHWNDRYRCYSYMDKERIIANVSVSDMNLILEGQYIKALQIGTVMTHSDYRGQGLSKALMQKIFEKSESSYDLIYLFAHSGVADFYPKFGFKALPESQFTLNMELDKAASGSIRKMNFTEQSDRKIVDRLLVERMPASSVFGVEHAEHIVSFYTYNILNDAFYYIEEQDVIIVYEQDRSTIHLYDIIAKAPVDFNSLLRRLPQKKVTQIRFFFTPDLLGIEVETTLKNTDDILFIRPATLNIETPFTYPSTAQA